MTKFFLALYDLFGRHKKWLAALVVVIAGILAFFASRIRLEEDITRFIPTDDKVKKYTEIFKNVKINDKLVVAVHEPGNSSNPDASQLISYGNELVEALQQKFDKKYIRDITFRLSGDMMPGMYDIFYRNMPYFLEEDDYRTMDSLMRYENIDDALKKNYRNLISPAGAVFKKFIARDPLSFTRLAIAKLSYLQAQDNFIINNDCVFTKDRKNLLIFISSANTSNETAKNGELISGLDEEIRRISIARGDKITADYYGAVAMAVGNAEQMKKDTMITMGIALVLLTLLFVFFFRKKRILLYILLPVAIGGIFSLAMFYFLKGSISTLAIGGGSIILGIAINYSVHWYTHLKHTGSARDTLRDLVQPMTIGSITTIGAFLSLLFVKSQALNDFGLFAALILIGAVLFTLIVLPHLMRKRVDYTPENNTRKNIFERISEIRFENSKVWTIVIIVLTAVFLYSAFNVGFESDLTKMNYVSDKLRSTERRLSQVTDSTLRAVYVVSTGTTLDQALRHNEQITTKLNDLHHEHKLHSFSSPGALMLSDSLRASRVAGWEKFWTPERKDTLARRLQRASMANDFRAGAFNQFLDVVKGPVKPFASEDVQKIRNNFLNEYISERPDQSTVITFIKARENEKAALLAALPENDNTVVIDRQYMAAKFSEVINDDFNTILWIVSLLVLAFLILSYGRAELGIIAFIPMLISWIWILGIMGIIGLKFNIFSIVLSAFIFGLGDDYSIFVMDGLLLEYKTGRKNLSSYKTAVILSALTTVIGVGVLIFARHPALRSVALTTIVGMLSVVFVSYTIAPVIFKWMISIHGRKRTFPITLGGILYAIVFYSYFIGGCIFTVLMGWTVIRILPVGRKKRKLAYHYLLYFVCRSTIYIMFMAKKRVINFSRDTFKQPVMVICSHQSLIDIPLALMWTPKMIMITKESLYNSFLLGRLVRLGGFLPASHGYEEISGKLHELIADGFSIFVFPEGSRSEDRNPRRFHKGAFYMAEQLELDILPMVMHGTGEYIKKGEKFGRRSAITVKFLEKIRYDDPRYGTNYSERTKAIQKEFQKEFYHIKEEYYSAPEYHRDLLIRNFIYKGPIVEWYMRIKLRLEQNYNFFNDLLPRKGHITDIGCGYGFMSYMLAMAGPERQITGIDYDEEKVAVANHGISKPPNTEFIPGDVLQIPFEKSAAFVIADVLHYMPEDMQRRTILKCAENLEPGGIIVIRDADTSLGKKHKGTWLTEFFSTKVLGFNKTGSDNKLHFTSREIIFETLKDKGFSIELKDDTVFTSNVIYIIRNI